MKMSAWIRFCLIVLCLAMACSMFACNTPEEQTTEPPVVDTTEAPSDEPTTEKPTEKPTETPTEVTTEEPVVTTEPTEVTTEPTEVTTEPTEVTTEPTEVTTEPTEVTTEVPATETTEAPETETTETETTPSEVETATDVTIGGDIVEEGDSGYIEEAVSPYKYNCDSHGGVVGSTFTTKIDPLTGIITGIKGWFAVEPGVMAYKYALVIDGVQQDMVDVTKANLPDGSGTVGYDRSDVVNHVAKNYPGFNASVAGHNIGFDFTHVLDYATLAELHGHSVEIKYYAVIFKVDVEGNRYVNENEEYEEGAYVLLATFKDIMPEHFGARSYRDNGDGTHSILCQACGVYYATEQCPAAKGEGATWVDTNSHSGMTCTLCGQTGVKGAHSAPTNTVWNNELVSFETIRNDIVWDGEKYISVCTACGGQAGASFAAIIDMEAEDMKIGQTAWGSKQINITDLDGTNCASITKSLHNGADAWSNTYLYINPAQIASGRYMAIRYRIMLAEGDRSFTVRTDTANGYDASVIAQLINDGEWHILVLDLAGGAFAPDANGNYIMSDNSRLDFTSWKAGDIILLDWFRTYDRLDAIGLEQDACDCPNFALKGVANGAEGHVPTCEICGKTFAMAAHTPSTWGRYDAEGDKYVSDCTVCGYTLDVIGNVVFDADALMNVSTGHDREKTETGVKFTNPNNADQNFTLFTGRGDVETGKYLFIKYRANGATNSQIFTATDSLKPAGNRSTKPSLNCDGEWHIAVIDLSTCITHFVAADSGKYYVQHFRLDVEGANGCWLEVEYIGFATDSIALAKSIKALDSGAADICECPTDFAVGTYVDEDVHAPVCQLCGKQGESVAHSGGSYGVWNETLGYYESGVACVKCGEKYDYGCTVGGEAEKLFTNLNQWNLNRTVEGDFVKFTKNNATVFCASPLGINPTGAATGKYMVMRYRANTEAGTDVFIKYTSGGSVAGIKVNNDGEWHVEVITLGADFTDGDVRFMFYNGNSSYGWVGGESFDLDWIRMYDSFDRISGITQDVCPHPANAKKTTAISDTEHAVVCMICDKEFDKADHVYTTTNCANGWVCSCGQPSAPTEHTTAGTNNEYCTTCKSFVNADPATLFNKFIGGANVPANANGGGASNTTATWSDNGYRLYTKTAGSETYVQPSYDGSETGQFMVMKFKATGSMNFDFFTSTVQAGASGSYTFNYVPATYDEWQYLIVDLSKKIGNSGVAVDGNGKYCIKGLRLDVQSGEDGGTAEIAYIAYANSIKKLVDGILALEGVENIKNDYCLCDGIIQTGVYVDENTHVPTCALCGVQGEAAPHAKGTHGVWNEELGFYAYECTTCGGQADYGCTAGGEAEDLFTNLNQWNLSRTVEGDFVKFTKNDATVFCATTFAINPTGAATGKYMVIRYRANTEAGTDIFVKYTSAGSIAGIKVVNDGEWHIAIITLGADFTDGDVRFNFYNGNSSYGWVGGESFDLDWIRMYDSADRIPAEYQPAA